MQGCSGELFRDRNINIYKKKFNKVFLFKLKKLRLNYFKSSKAKLKKKNCKIFCSHRIDISSKTQKLEDNRTIPF